MSRYCNAFTHVPLYAHRIRGVDPFRVKFSTKVEVMNRVHILGAGNLGIFLAHSLRKSHPELPITLMVRRSAMLKTWNDYGRSIEIVTNGISDLQSNFDLEVFGESENGPSETEATISNLIVATKAPSTKVAVQKVLSQLQPSCTHLFLQNGMGKFISHDITSIYHNNKDKRSNRRGSISLHLV
jgi:2-dehydropantoate 2-reductase